MTILDDARQLVTRKREEEQRERQLNQLEEERWHKQAIFDALEILGASAPQINYSHLVHRAEGVDWPCFEVGYEGLIIRNGSKQYANHIDLEEAATGRHLTVNTERGFGETGDKARRREMWTAQIAKEWYGL